MTIDFNGGIHEVILFKDGRRYDKSNFPILFNSIASVSVKFGNENLGTMEVQITPSLEDGFKILDSGLLGIGMTQKGQAPELLSQNGNASRSIIPKTPDSIVSSAKPSPPETGSGSVYPVLAIRFLYQDQLDNDQTEASTPWYVGICNVPDLSLTATEMIITMKAASQGVQASKFIATARFENESIFEAVQKLVKPFGIAISFDDDDTRTEELLKSKTYTGISAEPPLLTIKNILMTVDCYFSLISGDGKNANDEIRIKSRQSVNEGKIDFTFVLYRQIDPAKNVIPIYDFSLSSNGALFLPGGAFGSSQAGIDSETKDKVTLEVDDQSNRTKALSGNQAGAFKVPEGEGKTFGVSNGINPIFDVTISGDNIPVTQSGTLSNRPEIESKALSDGTLGLFYQITVPGLPRLRAMRLAQVIIGDNIKGISGPGQIYTITHRTGSDGWVSEIEFRRQPGLVDGASVDVRKTEPTARPTQSNSKKPIGI